MKRFPWLEVLMIAALAVALITKPQDKSSAAAPQQPTDPISVATTTASAR